MTRWLVLAGLMLAASAGPAAAQVSELTVTGRVAQPQTVTLEGLASMRAFEVVASDKGTAQATFVGAMLWDLIAAAQPIDGPERGSHLQHVIYARGADGYAVAVAIGEIDPQFEGKPVLVAYKENGALLPAPRLVVPADRRAGRNVHDLVALEVR